MDKIKIYRVTGFILILLGIIRGYQFIFPKLLPKLIQEWPIHRGYVLSLVSFLILVLFFFNPGVWLGLFLLRRAELIQSPSQKKTKLNLFIKIYIILIALLFLFAVIFIAPHL
jgi:fatty acid desaturase